MPAKTPAITPATYQQLVHEAMRRIPVHTPEWTNQNHSDPGVTIIELFAHLTEHLIFRSSLTPERNHAKFLQLLQMHLRPANASHGLVAFDNPRGVLNTYSLPRETLLRAGRVEFRTLGGLSVLPISGRVYIKRRVTEDTGAIDELYQRLYPDLTATGTKLEYYETQPLELPTAGVDLPSVNLTDDTADSSLWLALLARSTDSRASVRQEIANKILTIGILPDQDSQELSLPPVGFDAEDNDALVFQIPRLQGSQLRYERLEARPSTNLIKNAGTVEIRLPDISGLTYEEDLDPLEPGVSDLPPSLIDTDYADQLLTWIRIRAPELTDGQKESQLKVRFNWIGINASEIQQRSRVRAERLADGNGEPNQRTQLLHTPVLPETLEITVNGELWQPIDDLAAAGPEADMQMQNSLKGDPKRSAPPQSKVFKLDPESGLVSFGDGTYGTRPPRDATIIANYSFGGGRQGMVGIGTIDKGEFPAGLEVRNHVPTWGGSEAETIEEAEFRIPSYLRHRDRLVSEKDFRDITWETPGVDLGRVEVLPLFHPAQPGVDTAGVVTVLLIPRFDSQYPETPEPDRLFLDAVCKHLNPRRLVTTEMHLRGPSYQGLWVSVGIEILKGFEQGPILDKVDVEIRRFLSPLAGGFQKQGWPLNTTVEASALLATATRVTGVARVVDVLLSDQQGNAVGSLNLTGLQLPRLLGISVALGLPLPISELRGDRNPNVSLDSPIIRLPVPLVPEEC